MRYCKGFFHGALWALAAWGMLSGAAMADEKSPGLAQNNLDSRVFLNPPPPWKSAEGLADLAIARRLSAEFYGSDRWLLAALDAEMSTPEQSVAHFNCVVGVPISPATAPGLSAFLYRMAREAHDPVVAMKAAAQRERPFMRGEKGDLGPNGAHTCRPDHANWLRGNGSYPSGHSAFGYALGLLLAQIDPDRATAIMARARQFGESRLVCNVHWNSDVEAGREVAAIGVALLSARPGFAEALNAARAEYRQLQARAGASEEIKRYVLHPASGSAANQAFVRDLNRRLAGWNCAKEAAVLSAFSLR